MQSGFEQQIKGELFSEIEALEKNYTTIKDVLSGAEYGVSDIKGTLESFKDNLSKVASLLMVLSQLKGTILTLPIDSLVRQIDLALSIFIINPQAKPSDVIHAFLSFSEVKIEYIMSLASILKKTL